MNDSDIKWFIWMELNKICFVFFFLAPSMDYSIDGMIKQHKHDQDTSLVFKITTISCFYTTVKQHEEVRIENGTIWQNYCFDFVFAPNRSQTTQAHFIAH